MTRAVRCLVPIAITAFGATLTQAAAGPAPACSAAVDSSRQVWAVADFDGDNALDLARVKAGPADGGFVVDVCKNWAPATFGSLQRTGLVLSARDIDADQDQDLVLWEQSAGKAVGVWINDGEGGFSEREPSDFAGAGDDARGVQKHDLRFHRLAANSPSKTCASVPPSGGPVWLAPASPRRSVQVLSRASSGWRELRQTRAPPFPSC